MGGILVDLVIGDLMIGDTAMELGTPGKYPAFGLKVLISVRQPSHSVSTFSAPGPRGVHEIKNQGTRDPGGAHGGIGRSR